MSRQLPETEKARKWVLPERLEKKYGSTDALTWAQQN